MATLLKSSTFDVGDFSEWDGEVDFGLDLTVESTRAYYGKRSARFFQDDTLAEYLNWNVTPTKYYISCWLWIPSNWTQTNITYRWLTFRWNNYWYLRSSPAGTLDVFADCWGGGGGYVTLDTDARDDSWHRVEMFAEHGGGSFWSKFDGIETHSGTTVTTGAPSSLRVGNSSGAGPTTEAFEIFMDGVEIWDDIPDIPMFQVINRKANFSTGVALSGSVGLSLAG